MHQGSLPNVLSVRMATIALYNFDFSTAETHRKSVKVCTPFCRKQNGLCWLSFFICVSISDLIVDPRDPIDIDLEIGHINHRCLLFSILNCLFISCCHCHCHVLFSGMCIPHNMMNCFTKIPWCLWSSWSRTLPSTFHEMLRMSHVPCLQ